DRARRRARDREPRCRGRADPRPARPARRGPRGRAPAPEPVLAAVRIADRQHAAHRRDRGRRRLRTRCARRDGAEPVDRHRTERLRAAAGSAACTSRCSRSPREVPAPPGTAPGILGSCRREVLVARSARAPTPSRSPALAGKRSGERRMPMISWTEHGAERTARWHSENGAPPPTRLDIADDTLTADRSLRRLRDGTALLWRGDYPGARQLLTAVGRRIDRRRPPRRRDVAQLFRAHRAQRAERARRLGGVVVLLEAGHRLYLRRAPDVGAACRAAYGSSEARRPWTWGPAPVCWPPCSPAAVPPMCSPRTSTPAPWTAHRRTSGAWDWRGGSPCSRPTCSLPGGPISWSATRPGCPGRPPRPWSWASTTTHPACCAASSTGSPPTCAREAKRG